MDLTSLIASITLKLANFSASVSLSNKPLPAGINLPVITFSFKPCNGSILPLIAASVKTFVVSWNDAPDKNESVSKAAFVIPKTSGLQTAGFLPSSKAALFFSVNSTTETFVPLIKSVSPESIIKTFLSICLTITSICLSEIPIP